MKAQIKKLKAELAQIRKAKRALEALEATVAKTFSDPYPEYREASLMLQMHEDKILDEIEEFKNQ